MRIVWTARLDARGPGVGGVQRTRDYSGRRTSSSQLFVASTIPSFIRPAPYDSVTHWVPKILAATSFVLCQSCLSLFVVVSVLHVRGRGLRIPAQFPDPASLITRT
ncbi:unnamed protein product [Boreogadus saida]